MRGALSLHRPLPHHYCPIRRSSDLLTLVRARPNRLQYLTMQKNLVYQSPMYSLYTSISSHCSLAALNEHSKMESTGYCSGSFNDAHEDCDRDSIESDDQEHGETARNGNANLRRVGTSHLFETKGPTALKGTRHIGYEAGLCRLLQKLKNEEVTKNRTGGIELRNNEIC